jgi:50S ribosomal protein L16 3-hydroxylase
MTYSIGFRAASYQETMSALLDDMQDVLQLEGQFSNAQPVAASPASTARLPEDLLDQLEQLVKRQWPNRSVLKDFLGRALTEPKPSATFAPVRGSLKSGVELARATRALFAPGWFFINGESWKMGGDDARRLMRLAQQRSLSAQQLQGASDGLLSLLDEWREMGWINPARNHLKRDPKAPRF